MTAPTRLPVQHPESPHCPTCKGNLPNFNDMIVTVGAQEADYTMVSMTFRIRCRCGSVWDLTKTVRGS